MSLLDDVHRILDPGVQAIEEGVGSDLGDAMNMLGRVVAAVEHIARVIDGGGANVLREPNPTSETPVI